MRILAIIFILFYSSSAEACFILLGKKNNRVLVGNNEDWYHSDAKYWVEHPRSNKGEKYSALFFGFKGEFTTAQGGVNEKGLFFDATAVPVLTLSDSAKAGREKAIHPIFKNILKSCANVEEAAAYLQRFYVPFIKKVQVVLADAQGGYLVVNVNGIAEKGKVDNTYRIITNFHTTDRRHFCYRYDSAESRLQKQFDNSVSEFQDLLNLNHQNFPGATVYSTVFDLTEKKVHLYYNHHFDQSITIDLAQEMKGEAKSFTYLEEKFKKRMIEDLIRIHDKKGVKGVVEFFKTERAKKNSPYEIDDTQLSDLTTRLINRQHFADAYAIAQQNEIWYPESDLTHEQLGRAMLYTNRKAEALVEYNKALAINPRNRWAGYVLKQFSHPPSGATLFSLNGYPDAYLVSVQGAFNEWQDLQNICYRNGDHWECQVQLPDGMYPYRFMVNGIFIDDPKNPPSLEIQKGFMVSMIKVVN